MIAGVVLACAAGARAPGHEAGVWLGGPAGGLNAPPTRGFAEPPSRRPVESAAAGSIAGGKLLLSRRLKLIIKYHQVIPA